MFRNTQLAFWNWYNIRLDNVLYQQKDSQFDFRLLIYKWALIAISPATLTLYILFRLILIPIMIVTDILSVFINAIFIFTDPIPITKIIFSYFSQQTALTNIVMALTGLTILAIITGLIADTLLTIRLISPTLNLFTGYQLDFNKLIYSGMKEIEKTINPSVSDWFITQAALSNQSIGNLEISNDNFSATPAIEAVSPIDFYALALASYCKTESEDGLRDAIEKDGFQTKIKKTFGEDLYRRHAVEIIQNIIAYAITIKKEIAPPQASGETDLEKVNNAMQIAKLNISNQSRKGIGGKSTNGLLANCWEIKYGEEVLFKRFSHPARHGKNHAEALLDRRKLAFGASGNQKFEFSLVGNSWGHETKMNTAYKKALQEKGLTQKIKFLEIPVYEQGNWKDETFKKWNQEKGNIEAYDALKTRIDKMANNPMKQLAQKALTTKIGNKNASSIAAILAMATQGTTYCKSAKDRAGFVTVQAWAIKETLKGIKDDQFEKLKDILLINDNKIDDIKDSKYYEIKAIHADNLAKAYLSQINDNIAQRNCPHAPGTMNSLKLLKKWEKEELGKTVDGRKCLAFMTCNDAIANLNKGTAAYDPSHIKQRKDDIKIKVLQMPKKSQEIIFNFEKKIECTIRRDGDYKHTSCVDFNNQLERLTDSRHKEIAAEYLAFSIGLANLKAQYQKAQNISIPQSTTEVSRTVRSQPSEAPAATVGYAQINTNRANSEAQR